MADFHFLRPWWLLALVPACLIAQQLGRGSDAGRAWRNVVSPHLLRHLLVGEERKSRFGPLGALLAVWLLASVALAGPAWQREPSPFAEDTAALVFVLKVTPSMESKDVQPTRLQRATEKLHDLLARRTGSMAALVVYAGSVHRAMPLTRDTVILDAFAAEMSPGVMPVEGSKATAALAAADELLTKSRRVGEIVWIADGATQDEIRALEQFAGKPHSPVVALAVAGEGPELESLEKAASVLGAPLVRVTSDDADVERLAHDARFSGTNANSDGQQWKDFGYWLVWPIVAISAFGFRRGWVVQSMGDGP